MRPILVNYLKKNGINVKCFGSGWEAGSLPSDEMIKIYSQTRVNLGFGYVGFSSDQCLKGRDFEVPSCGAVYLTSYNENLPRVYKIREEIETYLDFKDCVKKSVCYYLIRNDAKECVYLLEKQYWKGILG